MEILHIQNLYAYAMVTSEIKFFKQLPEYKQNFLLLAEKLLL